ncbi:MAG: beta-propeller fold lactonase family protein [Chlorobi bacterium]|nr:beta-propeller fold lactonase family protein [Chlorobiota bacterium]MCI0715439.1 beta-propeller fold lactonase family protein [Chlorobiota bacterium]
MKRITISLLFPLIALFAGLINLAACNDSPVEPKQSVSFSQDILPVFESNCNFPGCHNSVDKQSGIDLTSWGSLMLRGSTFGAEVIPYNSKWSHLVQHINVDTNLAPSSEPLMPKPLPPYTNGSPLPENIVKLLMQWIDQGAKNDFGEVAYSNITRKAFITNQSSDFVVVVNLDNNFVTRYVKVGTLVNTPASPHNVAVDNQGRYFYTTLIREGSVEKYDEFTYEKLGSLHAVTSPAHVIITPDGTKGYITNYNINGTERFIKSFITADMTVLNTIADITMNATHGGRITSNGEYLITVSELGEYIQIIRTADDALEQTIPVANIVPPNGNGTGLFRPIAVSLSPDDRYAFVTCDKSNDVRVLDLNSRTITHIIPTGLFPIQSECTPDGRWLYVANRNSNSVTVIDLNTFTVAKTIPSVGVQPHGVAFTPDGRYAYVTCESQSGTFVHHPAAGSSRPGTTAVIDVINNHTKIKDIEMASFPAGISITK